MTYKTLSRDVAARLAAMPIDYEWDATIGNGFIAASEEDQPRLAEAIETVNIHGAADLVVGAIEWCLARAEAHVPAADGQLRLQAAWAATVDPRYSTLGGADPDKVAPDDLWTRPERRARAFLRNLVGFLEEGDTAKVRGTALGAIMMAEHLCGRDAAFGPWLTATLQAKRASSPRRADDVDYTSTDLSASTPQELTAPGLAERLAALNPASNPYLRSAADIFGLGFAGDPYPQRP